VELVRRQVAFVVAALVVAPLSAGAGGQTGGVAAWGCAADTNGGQCTVPASAQRGITAIAAGAVHSLALTQDGRVLEWGEACEDPVCNTPPPQAQSGVVAIAAGLRHSIALRADGTIDEWGFICGAACPYALPPEARPAVAISAGDFHDLLVTSSGRVYAWGCGAINGGFSEDRGQCSVPPDAMSGVTAVAAGADHSLALRSDGRVVAWGCLYGSDEGQCAVPPAAKSGVIAIAAGQGHSLALKADGSVVAWGCNGFDLGQCTVPEAAKSDVTAIAAGRFHSVALKKDGSVVAWGCGPHGYVFDGGQCVVSSAGSSGVIAISGGAYHTLVLKAGDTAPRCTVPRVVGKPLATAKRLIAASRCRTGSVRYAYSRKWRKGVVTAESRPSGQVLAANAKIDLVVSRGRKR
jgi:hypothetical protein